MSERPDFGGFSPDDQKYFNYLDRLWEHLPFEEYRTEYIKAIIGRSRSVAEFIKNRDNPYKAMKLCEQNHVAYSHFLYYLDQLFAVPPERTDRAHYVYEIFYAADMSQQELNTIEQGKPQLYEEKSLKTTIESILLGDSDDGIKQEIVTMYEQDIYDVAQRATEQTS